MKVPRSTAGGLAWTVLLVAACGSTSDRSPPPAASAALPPASTIGAPAAAPATAVFAVALAPGAAATPLVARGDALSALRTGADGVLEPVWTSTGSGVVQRIASGDAGDGFAVWVARGRSATARAAPLVLERVDPASGRATEVWRFEGPRNEAVALGVDDVDGDGRDDLAFAYFVTERGVRTRDRLAGGTVVEADLGHMATSRVFVDLDGDGREDEIVGHLYDVDPEGAGKLRARLGGRWVDVPTSGGIRALAALPAPGGRGAVLVSDGWSKRYGADGRARVGAARWDGSAFTLQPLVASPADYTFFDLSIGGPGEGEAERVTVLARGNATTQLLRRTGADWVASALPPLAASEGAVLVRGGSGELAAIDVRDPARFIPLR